MSKPKGWRPVHLIDAGTWLSGGTPSTDVPRYWDGDIPWISAASLKNFRISNSDRRVTQDGAKIGTRLISKGTVLFVVRGMSLKKEFRVGVAQRELTFGQDCKAIAPHPEIDGTFLALAMKARTPQILSMVDEAGHGTGRLPTDLISRLVVDVPPLAEQRQIVEIFDTFDEQITAAKQVLIKYRATGAAVATELIPVLPDARDLGDGWELVPLLNVVPSTDYGISAPLTTNGGGTPTLRMNNLAGGRIVLHEIKTVNTLVPSHLILKNGDVLFNRTNSIEHVGRTSIWRGELSRATFASYLVRLNPNPERIQPEYLVRWLNLPAIQQRIRRLATPGVQQVNINPTSLRRTMIELPTDVSRQQEIAAILDEFDRVADAMNAEISHLQLLKQGLMDDLLTGRIRVRAA